MKIGIPNEIRPGERRVAATPETVSRLLKRLDPRDCWSLTTHPFDFSGSSGPSDRGSQREGGVLPAPKKRI
jgi:hypothetical protein